MSAAARHARVLLCICLGLGAGCAHLPDRPVLPVETAPAPAVDAPLDRVLSAAENGHPGESGFRLVVEGTEAFALARAERAAGRSAASMCRPTSGTPTPPGCSWRSELLEAADRGVHVRLLVDDMDARAKNAGFAALAAHPQHRSANVQSVRLAQRQPAAGRRRRARFRPHQPAHAQQELDRRQPHRAGRADATSAMNISPPATR